jgi:DNA-binding beta-propeller fold protein YncE
MFVYIPVILVYPSKMLAASPTVRMMTKLHLGMAALALTWTAGCGGGGGGNPPPPPDGPPVQSDRLVAFSRTGDLYVIDPVTGVDTLRLDTSLDGQDIGVVSSALYVAEAGTLWLGTGAAGVTACKACVLRLDLATGQATVLDNATNMKGVADMARSPLGGFIYATNGNSRDLWGVNPADGQAQLVGAFSQGQARGGGLTFDASGLLYGSLDNILFRVDPATSTTTQVNLLTYSGFAPPIADGAINSMAVLGNTVYGILFDRESLDGTTYLVRIDTSTAAVTFVAQNSVLMEGLAVVPANLLP